ncbi:hypothetical protein [Halalkalibacter akibai]|uniref:Uncharacterized protein n=1 Tax=Halalkalibacter akibai (strain ATCC 43226 / DSM 21942 / CIP 109018 / JCM 9157 / 1139) TaxID=1236973 RepID=W4QQJ0_HALA3|nr:hypothetical protein [Halalkalibacter akibai]GAE34346.1 hypothetical protein JCM9157_1396 [Halalkalibacter akibai JCM 9157]
MDLTEKHFERLSKKSYHTLEKLQQQYKQEFGDSISKEELLSLVIRYSKEKAGKREKKSK